MDILMVTPELAPYARATRAGDEVTALAKALCQLEQRVTIAVPRHPGFEAGGLFAARRLTPLKLEGGTPVTVLDAQLPSGATLVLFDAPGLFDRPSVYGEGAGYPDNAARFGLFCAATAALIRQKAERREPFDVVHLHDWASAALAVTLRANQPDVPTVLTVHDAASHGVVGPEDLARYGIDGPVSDGAREGGGVSLLACGAERAYAVTTASPTTARDLGDPSRFGVLSTAIAQSSVPVVGVVGGLDYAMFNPATDPALKARYDAEDPSNKGRSKAEFLKTHGLDVEVARPLVVVLVGSEADDDGGLLENALDSLLKCDISLVVAAVGSNLSSERFTERADDYPDRFAADNGGDDAFLRRAVAAADLVVLPARYEMTGTWARAAQRYGALPVAHAAGANVDCIVDCDAELETGTGFLYDVSRVDDLMGAVTRGIAAYRSARWPSLRRRAMRLDLAWDRPARRYIQVYRQAIAAAARTP